MKHIKIILLLIFSLFAEIYCLNNQTKINVIPYPKEVIFKEGIFRINNSLSIKIDYPQNSSIYSAATRFLRRLDARTGLFLKQDFISPENNPNEGSIVIKIKRQGELKLGEDESYSLSITKDKITIFANTDIGAVYALETLLQLLSADNIGYYFPALQINDEPRFPWRGLMLDVSRHFMPVDVIKKTLDAMCTVKLNVFHWHLSDDQGFRVESKIFPKLHEIASDGLYYTQNEIKEIIKYARERGIRIIPEFDVPGHTTAWLVAYPEYSSYTVPKKIERNFGIFDPVFNPANPDTYIHLEKFFSEMFELFPDEYFHIGGDEVKGKDWDKNPHIKKFMSDNNIKDNSQLQAYFNNRILQILSIHGKKMIGWDEILHDDMPNNIIIQSWRGTEFLVKAAKKGYMGILSYGYYLDLMQPASYHYLIDPVSDEYELSEDETKKILGGEAAMWTELATVENIDSRIWPRAAAIAERLWSPKHIKDINDMYRRLDILEIQLEEHGLAHIKNQEMILRRLANSNNIIALKNLVDVVEPLEGYKRHHYDIIYQQHSPYSRVVDAAYPESKLARKFKNLVDDYLKSHKDNLANEIQYYLNQWISNHDSLELIINHSPILKEIEPLSYNLKQVSIIGLETLSFLASKQKPKADWFDKSLLIVNDAKKSYGHVEFAIIEPIEKLLIECNK